MPTISPFGTLDYDDAGSIRQWQMAHDMRHITYAKEMGRRGNAITTPILSGAIDADWRGRHMQNHLALLRIMGPDQSFALTALEQDWSTKDKFYDWHRFHNLIHSKIDALLAIRT